MAEIRLRHYEYMRKSARTSFLIYGFSCILYFGLGCMTAWRMVLGESSWISVLVYLLFLAVFVWLSMRHWKQYVQWDDLIRAEKERQHHE
jgi:Ca2+/Na+ antiporter